MLYPLALHVKRQKLSLNAGPCAPPDCSLTRPRLFTPRLQGPYDQPRSAECKPRQHALGAGAPAEGCGSDAAVNRERAAHTGRLLLRTVTAFTRKSKQEPSRCRPLPGPDERHGPRGSYAGPATPRSGSLRSPNRGGGPGRPRPLTPQSPSARPRVGALRYVGAGGGSVSGSVLEPPVSPGPGTFEQAERRRQRRRRRRQLQAEGEGQATETGVSSCARAASPRVGLRALWRQEAPSTARPALS